MTPSPKPQASPSTLAGGGADTPPPTPETSSGPEGEGGASSSSGESKGLSMVIGKVKETETLLGDIGKQFPSALPAVRETIKSLRAVLRQVVANPNTPEPPAPNIGG